MTTMDRPQIQFPPEKKKSLIVGNKEFRTAHCFQLTEEENKRAEIELFETEERKKICLLELRERIAKEGIHCRTDDSYLLRYLRVRKFNCDIAYRNIKESASYRRKYPPFFALQSNLESLLNRNFVNYLPYADEEGNILFFGDFGKWDVREVSFDEAFQIATAVLDVIIENPRCQVNGVIGIYNFQGFGTHHITTTLANFGISKYSFLIQNFYPWRITRALVVNTGPVARLIFSLIRPFLSKKIADRIVFLGSDMSELHQYINPALLPKKLGGMLDEEQYCCTQNILDNIPFLKYSRSLSD